MITDKLRRPWLRVCFAIGSCDNRQAEERLEEAVPDKLRTQWLWVYFACIRGSCCRLSYNHNPADLNH